MFVLSKLQIKLTHLRNTQFPKSQNLIFINLTLKYDAFLFRTYELKIETILGSGSYFQLSCFAVSISERANSEFPQH